jgi:hypothetical protein
MYWEGEPVTPQATRLSDGTVYFYVPPGTVRVNVGERYEFWNLSNANSMLFVIEGGLVRKQLYSFERGAS